MKEEKISLHEIIEKKGVAGIACSLLIILILAALAVAFDVSLYHAAGATSLFYTMLAVSTVIFIAVILFILYITFRSESRYVVAERLNNQISSAAKFYISLCELNIPENTVVAIRNENPAIEKVVNSCDHNMQELFFGIMNNLPDSPTKQAAIDFCDLRDPELKFKDSDILTLEYVSYGDIWVRARYVVSGRDKDGRITHVLWLLENIDVEKRARDSALLQAEQLNNRMSSTADIYMSVYDFDLVNDTFNDVKASNATVVDLIGINRGDAQQTLINVMKHMSSEQSMEAVLSFVDFRSLPDRLAETNTITLEYLSSDNRWRRARFIASERSDSGELMHVLWLVEDIDRERKAREALIDKSERAIAANEAKSAFLSNMSHEIRTPITTIMGMNEMVLRESDDPSVITYSENIHTAGMTLLALINDILDFSKIEAGKLEIIETDYEVSSLLNDIVTMIQPRADDRNLILTSDFDESIPNVLHGDELRIRQIITNLLTNAVKYTERGTITFRVFSKKVPGDPGQLLLCVEVRDTGIGIKPEDMERLFSQYERLEEQRNRNVEGTGLGLAITQSLLSMMGSRLEVNSIYGKGSIFGFEIRQGIRSSETIGRFRDRDNGRISRRKKYQVRFTAPEARLLLVDDTEMNRFVFISLLKQTRMKIDCAESGDAAILLATTNRYDLIFLDHMMPGKDGITTLHELKALEDNPNRNTPVVCLTADAISGARKKFMDAGFDNYLSKPVSPEKLEEMILSYLPEEMVTRSDDD